MTEPADASPPPPTRPRPSWLEAVLAVLVVAFAFLAASFPVRNSDFWRHLAAGRLLAHSEHTFGVDPFAYTTAGVYWANHAWVYDLALYLGFRSLGGAGLVAVKAAAAAVLAVLLLRLSRSDEVRGPFWLRAGCVLLAVLALSPHLLLQPACLSLLLLAVCLLLLRAGGRALVALPAVIALWVNLDAWFLLGPLLVLLCWLGERLDPAASARRLPLWLLPACLVACLLSPHHVHALTLPPELSPAVRAAFGTDPRFAGLFASPWQLAALAPAGGCNLALWAFFVLLALGVVSFAVNGRARRSWRLTVWLAFALLAAWQTRLIPYFAVVAGPIAALNLGERLPARSGVRLGSATVLLAAVALIALTWPGWLQGFHRRDRPLGWSVRPDPALRRAAVTLTRWREHATASTAAHAFAAHPDVAHYCAWFAPGERCFIDSRLSLFMHVARDYRSLCRALETAPGTADLDRLLAEHGIDRVVLYDPDLRRLGPALRHAAEPEGRPLRVEGHAVILGRNDLNGGPPPFDADRLAFAPDDGTLPPADDGPKELARALLWWERLLRRPTGSAWEADAAAVYLRLFEDGAGRQQQRQQQAVLARFATGLVGGASAGPLGAIVPIGQDGVFLADIGERPAALPLLSVRAARRAVAEHPDDADAWFVLAQAYRTLVRGTAEASPHVSLPPLAQVREVQTATALVQAVTLRPELAAGHEALALLYAERRFFDLALHHRSVQLRLVRDAGRLPREEAAAFAARVELLEQAVEQMRTAVEDAENRFVIHAQPLTADPLARARLAVQLGLAGKALDGVLLHSHADLYGVDGLRLLLELLLATGRVADAAELLDRPEMRRNPDGLGLYDLTGTRPDGRRWAYRFPARDWFDVCRWAAAGHYDRAAAALERLRGRLGGEGEAVMTRLRPELALRLTADVGLGAVPEAVPLRLRAALERERVTGWLLLGQFLPVERADLHALEGILLLESGRPVRADEQFHRALELYRDAPETVPALPGLPLTLRFRERLRVANEGTRGP